MIQSVYEERIKNLNAELSLLAQKTRKFIIARLASILVGIVLFYLFISFSQLFSFISGGICLIAFVLMVRVDHANTARIKFLKYLLQLNAKELKALDGDLSGFEDGVVFKSKEHRFSDDLDLFGKSSLFQLINRTVSGFGSLILAQWLREGASTSDVLERQEAVRELAPRLEWRQSMYAILLKFQSSGKSVKSITDRLQSESIFIHKKWLFLVSKILPVVTILVCCLSLFILPAAVPVGVLLGSFFLYFLFAKDIALVQQRVTGATNTLKAYSEVLAHIENEEFNSPMLKKKQSTFSQYPQL